MVGFELSVGILEPFNCQRQAAIDESRYEAECLAAKIEQDVWHATAAAVRSLGVQVGDDRVVLSGRCRTYYIKQVAQQVAMTLADGRTIINQIVVT